MKTHRITIEVYEPSQISGAPQPGFYYNGRRYECWEIAKVVIKSTNANKVTIQMPLHHIRTDNSEESRKRRKQWSSFKKSIEEKINSK